MHQGEKKWLTGSFISELTLPQEIDVPYSESILYHLNRMGSPDLWKKEDWASVARILASYKVSLQDETAWRSLQTSGAIVVEPWHNVVDIFRVQRAIGQRELGFTVFPATSSSPPLVVLTLGDNSSVHPKFSAFSPIRGHTHYFQVPLRISSADYLHRDRDKRDFILAFHPHGRVELVVSLPRESMMQKEKGWGGSAAVLVGTHEVRIRDWEEIMDQEKIAEKLRELGLLAPESKEKSGLEEAGQASAPVLVLGPTVFKDVEGLREAVAVLRDTTFAGRILVLPKELPEGSLPESLVDQIVQIFQIEGASAFVYGDGEDPSLRRVTDLLRHWGIPLEQGHLADLAGLVQRVNRNAGPVSIQDAEAVLEQFFHQLVGLEEAA